MIKDIMSKNIISCKSNSTIYDISKFMKKYNIGFIPIIDNNLIGVITDRDIVINCIYNNDINISSYINNNVIYIDENDSLESALKLMKENKVKRLIVKKKKEIVGILSLSDILNSNLDNEILKTIKSIYKIKDNKLNNNPEIDEFYL